MRPQCARLRLEPSSVGKSVLVRPGISTLPQPTWYETVRNGPKVAYGFPYVDLHSRLDRDRHLHWGLFNLRGVLLFRGEKAVISSLRRRVYSEKPHLQFPYLDLRENKCFPLPMIRRLNTFVLVIALCVKLG